MQNQNIWLMTSLNRSCNLKLFKQQSISFGQGLQLGFWVRFFLSLSLFNSPSGETKSCFNLSNRFDSMLIVWLCAFFLIWFFWMHFSFELSASKIVFLYDSVWHTLYVLLFHKYEKTFFLFFKFAFKQRVFLINGDFLERERESVEWPSKKRPQLGTFVALETFIWPSISNLIKKKFVYLTMNSRDWYIYFDQRYF